jgi:hypothetical protein
LPEACCAIQRAPIMPWVPGTRRAPFVSKHDDYHQPCGLSHNLRLIGAKRTLAQGIFGL